VLWWQSANFDERAFDEPMSFDIRRDPNPHQIFDVGTHSFLVANLARLEILLVFEGLRDRRAPVRFKASDR
jgi:cytochrome P450